MNVNSSSWTSWEFLNSNPLLAYSGSAAQLGPNNEQKSFDQLACLTGLHEEVVCLVFA